jgi:hypothetical protein
MVAEVRHLRPSRDQVASDPEIQALSSASSLGQTHSRTADKRVLRGYRANQSGGRAEAGRVYLSVGEGSLQGKVELAEV